MVYLLEEQPGEKNDRWLVAGGIASFAPPRMIRNGNDLKIAEGGIVPEGFVETRSFLFRLTTTGWRVVVGSYGLVMKGISDPP